MSRPTPNADTRRTLLTGIANPAGRRDHVVELTGRVDGSRQAAVQLRYVPDRLIIEADGFTAYLRALGVANWPSLEHLAAAVADDMANELVARWMQVTVTAAADGDGFGHAVLVEDRQPRWDNKALLDRLRRF